MRRPIAPLAIGCALALVACISGSSGPAETSRSPAPTSPAAVSPGAASRDAPNILFIVTDDQRIGSLSVMPNTERLFRQRGVTYVNGFVVTPLCCPSRASILTGRYPHNAAVFNNHEALRLDQSTTVIRSLHAAGYLTAIAGKFLNNWPLDRDPPNFDRWAIFDTGYTSSEFNVDGDRREVKRYSTTFLGDEAVSFLRAFERHDSTPWFMYFATFAPHDPWEPDPRYADAPVPALVRSPAMRERDRSDKPPWVTGAPTVPRRRILSNRADQLRTLMSVDDQVGRIFATLRRLGEQRSTLAVFMSDNGWLWGEHGLAGDRGDSESGKAAITGKRYPYTESIRVPLMARWPGHIEPGTVDHRIVANVDLTPTWLEAAGVPPDLTVPLDGRSLLQSSGRVRLFLEYRRDRSYPLVRSWASIRTRRLHYIEWLSDSGRVVFREYYDLRSDPAELDNLLGDGSHSNDPDVRPLHAEIRRDMRCRGTSGPAACP